MGRQPDNSVGTATAAAAWPVVASVHVGYLTLAQAAKYVGCSARTLRRWVEAGDFPHFYVRLPGQRRGRLFFRKGQIDRWLRKFKGGMAGASALAEDFS